MSCADEAMSAAGIGRVIGNRDPESLAVEVVLGPGNHYFVTKAEVVDGGRPDGVLVLRISHRANWNPLTPSGVRMSDASDPVSGVRAKGER